MLFWGADQNRYLKLKDDDSNNMIKGVKNFPKTMVKMLQLMSNYKVPARAQHVKENGVGVAFAQERKVMNAMDIECWPVRRC